MIKRLQLLTLLITTFLAACTPDFYADRAIDVVRHQVEQEQRQKEEQRWQRIEEKLGIEVPDGSKATQDSLEVAFPMASFPRGTCGDPLPQNTSLYPVTYYRVYISNVGDNLREVKSEFCADAYVKENDDGKEVIQVGSFYTEKASEFLLLMESNFGEAQIGSATTVQSPR